MPYRLNVPTYDNQLTKRTHARDLWRFYTVEAGFTLINEGGEWRLEASPSMDTLNSATQYFRGGYQNIVDDATAASLIAAGYGANLEPI